MGSEDSFSFREVDGIKSFEFPVACHGMRITTDRKKILAVGTYKPSIRVFDLDSLSLKFERHMISDPIQIESLVDNGEKFVVLRADKCLEFHTRNGLHELVRMPAQPRTILFNKVASELYASGEYDSVYRFNLEQGRFLREIDVPNIIKMGFSLKHGLIGGISKHNLYFVDSRSKAPIISRDFPGAELCSIGLNKDGFTFAVGDDAGTVCEYDIRSEALLNKTMLGEPVTRLVYADESVFCQTSKKVSVCVGGHEKTAVVPGFVINDFDVNGGVLSIGGEYEEMRCYASDAYGPIPDWCKISNL